MKNKLNPRVSIIIPAYNASKYLREAIDSALNQTYKNIEIIVVNDGSKDKGKTEKIAKSYGNKIIYLSKENGGVSTALNLAITKMTGEYFSWLSHDDRYYPEKVQKQIDYLKENDLIGKKIILYSDYDLMDIHSRIFATNIKDHEELMKKPEYSLLRGAINGLSLLIPKEAFKECGNFNEELHCVQDYELWQRMQKKYAFVHLPQVLVTTRLHNQQQGNTSPRVLTEGNKFWIDLIEDVNLETKIRLEKTEYNFYRKMLEFIETTPYKEVSNYLTEKIFEIRQRENEKIKKIKVSVVIPFYNRNKILNRAIDTVLNQTHKNIEIILIDDGSTEHVDGIENLLKENKNVIYKKLEKNYGASYARNVGIDEATGEYIAFLDSDDEFITKKIEKQLLEMYLGDYNFSHTSYKRKSKNGEEKIIESGNLNGNAIPRIIATCGIATPTIMIKTNYLKEKQLKYNENLKLGEDICFYLEALKHTEILGIKEPLTIVNTNDTNASCDSEKQILGIKNIVRYILNDKELSKYDFEIALLFGEYMRVFSEKGVLSNDTEKYRQILNSTSWKITKPLRLFKNVINLYRQEGIIYTTKKIIRKILRKLKILK